MNGPLILSLFPGVDLLGHAFEAEWPECCVVRGPDLIFGSLSDIRRFHPPAGKFDGVIGGPPCQSFSPLARLVRANGYEPRFGNLIPEFERCVAEAQPDWFLMENVPQAPEPAVAGYGLRSFLLDNSALDGGDGFGLEQRRVRRFSFGLRGREAPCLLRWIDMAVFLLPDAMGCFFMTGKDNQQKQEARPKTRRQAVVSDPSAVPVKIGGSGKVKRTRHECINGSHGVPPSVRDKVRKQAVASSDGGERPREREARLASVTSNVGGRGSDAKPQEGKAAGGEGRYRLADALRLQGLPQDFLDDAPFTAEGKLKAVANGVPLPMGRAIARAVKEAIKVPPAEVLT